MYAEIDAKKIDIIIKQHVDLVNIEDKITYEILINNKESDDIQGVFVRINIPQSTTYVRGSLFLDTQYEPCNDYGGIIINELKGNSSCKILYDVKLNSIPENGAIVNESFYSFKLGSEVFEDISNRIFAEIKEKIPTVKKEHNDFICKINKTHCLVGEYIKLYLCIKNNLGVSVENLKLSVFIPPNLAVEKNSIFINKDEIKLVDPNHIQIPNLMKDDELEILIDFKVLGIFTRKIEANLKWEYEDTFTNKTVGNNLIAETEIIRSYETIINNHEKNILKEVDKKYCCIGDIINHKMLIENTGNVTAKNLVFKELEQTYLEYVKDSFKINDKSMNILDFESVFLGDLDPKKQKKITYKTKVKEIPSDNIIKSNAYIDFEELIDEGVYLNKKIWCTKNFIESIGASLNYELSSNTKFIELNEEFSLEINFKNIGNVNLNQLVINDANDQSIDILYCSEKLINEKIIIDELACGEEKKIQLIAKCNELHIDNYLDFNFKVTYKYFFKDKTYSQEKSRYFKIKVINNYLDINMRICNENAFVGDTIYSTLRIINKGKYILEDAVLEIESNAYDAIDIDNITFNNKALNESTDNLNKKIPIGEIKAESTNLINYNLICNKIGNFAIKAKIYGYYKINGIKERVSKIFCSNEVIINVEYEGVKLFLLANKNILYGEGCIKYRAVIINEGSKSLNISYEMFVSKLLKEIKDGVEINGEEISDEDLERDGIQVEPGDGVVIEKNYYYNNFLKNEIIEAHCIIRYKSNKKHTDFLELKSDKVVSEVVMYNLEETNV